MKIAAIVLSLLGVAAVATLHFKEEGRASSSFLRGSSDKDDSRKLQLSGPPKITLNRPPLPTLQPLLPFIYKQTLPAPKFDTVTIKFDPDPFAPAQPYFPYIYKQTLPVPPPKNPPITATITGYAIPSANLPIGITIEPGN